MVNTREFERKNVGVDVGGSIENVEGFHLTDLSQSGALIKSVENLKIGHDYVFNFKFAGNGNIPMKAKVMRCTLIGSEKSKSGEDLPLYEVGLKFIDPDKESLQKLSKYISQEEFKKPAD